MGETRVEYKFVVGKHEGNRRPGQPRCKWEYNIKVDFQELFCGGMDWIDVAQARDRWRALVDVAMNLRVP
jgi:hypothetical protein